MQKADEVPDGSQMADEVPDGSGVDSRQGSGWFRMVPVQIADAVPAGSGTDG